MAIKNGDKAINVVDVAENVVENVVAMMKTNNKITSKILAEKLNITQRQIQHIIAKLKKEGRIEHIGSNRNGCWNVL